MAYDFRYKFRVKFSDTDMAGIAHFANFFRYMEQAEHEFLRSLGTSVHDTSRELLVSWPRVHAECTYSAPLRFDDEVEAHLLICEKRHRSIRYGHLFYKQGVEQPVARGSVTVVCVSMDPATQKMHAVAIPEYISHLIEAAPQEIIERLDVS
jgi:YbgC/YbaW family acyl-CoA thioester hydrolase